MATVEKRGNSYKIIVSNGYDYTGTQLRQRMTWTPDPGMTPKQIEKELRRQTVLFEEKCKLLQVHDSNIRLADFAEQWMSDYAEKQLKPSTVATYRTFLPRVNAALGHIRLSQLQPRNLLQFYTMLDSDGVRLDTKYKSKGSFKSVLRNYKMTQAAFCNAYGIGHGIVESLCSGRNISKSSACRLSAALSLPFDQLFVPVSKGVLSGKTKLHYHRFISAMLETAVQWQIIAQNPCSRIKAPRAEHKEAAYLDEIQAAKLIEALEKEPPQYRAMILLLLNSGLRRGELCALCWEDIDFENAVLSVRHNAVYIPKRGVIMDTPKTKSSLRSIKLPSTIIPVMKQYKRWQQEYRLSVGDQWHDNHLVFPNWNGLPLYPDTLSNWFASFIKRHDLPKVTIHGLRHTNATLLIAAGTNLRTVSSRLGHSQAATTANIYAHAIQSADAAAADVLSNILSPIKITR